MNTANFKIHEQYVGVDSGQIMIAPSNTKFIHFSYPPARLKVRSGTSFNVYIEKHSNGRPGMLIVSCEKLHFEIYVGTFECESDELIVVDPCYINFTEDDNYTEPIFKEFYDKVCAITQDEPSFGTFEHDDIVGAVTNTAWGDGLYDCYFQTDEGGYVTTIAVIMY